MAIEAESSWKTRLPDGMYEGRWDKSTVSVQMKDQAEPVTFRVDRDLQTSAMCQVEVIKGHATVSTTVYLPA